MKNKRANQSKISGAKWKTSRRGTIGEETNTDETPERTTNDMSEVGGKAPDGLKKYSNRFWWKWYDRHSEDHEGKTRKTSWKNKQRCYSFGQVFTRGAIGQNRNSNASGNEPDSNQGEYTDALSGWLWPYWTSMRRRNGHSPAPHLARANLPNLSRGQ